MGIITAHPYGTAFMGWEYPGKEPGILVPTDIPDGNIEGSSQGCFSQHSMDIPDGSPMETNGFLKHREIEFQIPKSLKTSMKFPGFGATLGAEQQECGFIP